MPETINRGTRTKVAFGEVVQLSRERTNDPQADGFDRYVGLEHIEPGELKIRSWGDIADGTTFTSVFHPGQVLFGKRRAYQRKVAAADFSGVCSGDIYVLEPSNDRLLPELLPFICQTDGFFEHAVGTSAGSLSPRTNWKSLSTYEFALPPLEEQRRIVEALQATEGLVNHLQCARSDAWATRLSAYRDLTQANTVALQEKNPTTPGSWRMSTVGDALLVRNGLRKPISSEVRARMPGPYPYYGPTGQLDSLDEYRLDGTYALIGEDGDHFLKNSIWSMTQLVSGRFNVSNHAHVLSGTESCLTEWFFHYYRHRDTRRWLTKQGATRLKLTKEALMKLPIALPPVEEQRELVKHLERVADATEQLDARISEAASLQRHVLESAMGAL